MKTTQELFNIVYITLRNYYENESLGYTIAKELFFFVTKEHYFMIKKDQIMASSNAEKILFYLHQISGLHLPYQYILGEVYFVNSIIKILPPVLIPRSETELLMSWLIEKLESYKDQHLSIIDFCSGSGCIGISLLKFFEKSRCDAFDISYNAITLSSLNAKINNVQERYKLHHKNIFDIRKNKKYDIIVSNPPYISLHKYQELDKSVYLWEDKIALTDGGDGCSFIIYILRISKQKMKVNSILVIEICDSVAEEILSIARTMYSSKMIFLWHDQYDKKRALVIVSGIFKKIFNR